jgi:hypothetical protein
MKRNSTLLPIYAFALLFSLVFIFSSSCRRNKDCDLVITLQDAVTNGPVVGATVWVHPKASTGGNLQIQDQTTTTDGAGVATFTFKLPAILEAEVTPPAPYVAPAPTLVKLEEGRSVSKAIKVY